MIHLLLPITPAPKLRPRFDRRGIVHTPTKTRAFEHAVRMEARAQYIQPPLAGPLKLKITFLVVAPKKKVREYPFCKPDLDNLIKAVTDALNGVLWMDDAQIICIYALKLYSVVPDRGEIRLSVENVEEGEMK